MLLLESSHIRAEVEGARLPITRIACGDDPLAVARRNGHLQRMLDSVALANLLDEASHEFERCKRVILKAERKREMEEHLRVARALNIWKKCRVDCEQEITM